MWALWVGSQLTCLVAFGYPIMVGSWTGSLGRLVEKLTSLSPFFPFYQLSIRCSAIFSVVPLHSLTPLSLYLLLFIAWGECWNHDCSLIPLVWVGPNLIIPSQEYALLEMGIGTLELVLAIENCSTGQSPKALWLLRYSQVFLAYQSTMVYLRWTYTPRLQAMGYCF